MRSASVAASRGSSTGPLVVTDLDGTLWDGEERIHDRTLTALRSLIDAGVPVLVATGRRLGGARRRLDEDGLDLPIVALDGAIGRDGHVRFAHRLFDEATLTWLLDAFEAADVRPALYVDGDDAEVVLPPDPSTHPRHVAHLDGSTRTMALREAVAVHGVHAVGAYGVAGRAGRALADVVEGLRGVLPHQSGPDALFGGFSSVVYPPGTSKWQGVVDYCAHAGLRADDVLAVGDGPNDLELLAGSRTAFVVADAHPAALALADHVIEPASAGGWATVVEHL